jgi:hypothetical protein
MKSGFVYLWKDSKRNKFYLGSHSGRLDDGYTGSNKYFQSAYKSRPETFRRRILEFYESCTNAFIREREERWLSLIKKEELNAKYYNSKPFAAGSDIYNCLSDENKRLARLKGNSKIRALLATGIDIDSAEKIIEDEKIQIKLSKKKPGETWTNRKHSESSRQKMSITRTGKNHRVSFNHTAESREKLSKNNPNRKAIRTPIGDFYSAEEFCIANPIITPNGLRLLFKVLDLPISQRRAERCPLITKADIGQTLQDLGYAYIKDSDVRK